MTQERRNREVTKMSLMDRIVRFKEQDWVRRAMLVLPEWITPNGVTVFRTVLMIPVMILVLLQSYWWALGLFLISMLLDFVDGALAEARDLKTESGAFLDPLVDKVTVWMLLGVLASSMLAGWLLFFFVVMFGGILTGLRVHKIMHGPRGNDGQSDIKARSVGKIKLITEVVSLSVVLLGLALEISALVWLGSLLMFAAVLLGGASVYSHVVKRG